MQAGWRTLVRTVGVTFTLTTAFWFAVTAWWHQRHGETAVPAPAQTSAALMATPPPPVSPKQAGLLIPVAGVRREQLSDTFTQARASGARRHDAIDILAPRGTPVIAAAAGRVEKLFLSKDGGKTAYVRSPDGRRIYYYAHLDSYAPGLSEGMELQQGTPIGAVGSTGNADPAAPHLHFAIWLTAPDRKWWEDAAAINPYPLLRPS